MSLKVARNDKFLHDLRKRLLDLKKSDGSRGTAIKSLVREIDANLEQVDAWEIFEQQLQSLDPDFLHGLTAKCPSLTPAEIRLCSLLRINMSNKDIAALLNISDRTVDTHRTRIRKKLGLKKEESLVGELARI